MKMTELTEFEAEFLDGFFFPILDSNFIDEVFNNGLINDDVDRGNDVCVKSTETVEIDEAGQIKDEDKTNELTKCHKRKLSNEELDNERKPKERRLNDQQPPDIDILKQAVQRLKNESNKTDASENGASSSESTGTASRQLMGRPKLKKNPMPTSQIQVQPFIEKIIRDICKGLKIMILMRGPPGSGKSHLARQIIDATTNGSYSNHIFSACDFFYNRDGCFNFDPLHVDTSHEWNEKRIRSYVSDGWSPIIVDNTNIKKWEMDVYVRIAVQNGYLLKLVKPNTQWSKSAAELEAKNVHNVPRATRMMSSLEETTVDNLIRSTGLKYTVKMPQYRRQPPLS